MTCCRALVYRRHTCMGGWSSSGRLYNHADSKHSPVAANHIDRAIGRWKADVCYRLCCSIYYKNKGAARAGGRFEACLLQMTLPKKHRKTHINFHLLLFLSATLRLFCKRNASKERVRGEMGRKCLSYDS